MKIALSSSISCTVVGNLTLLFLLRDSETAAVVEKAEPKKTSLQAALADGVASVFGSGKECGR